MSETKEKVSDRSENTVETLCLTIPESGAVEIVNVRSLRKLGEGGEGSVYSLEGISGFEKCVVKILHGHLRTDVRERKLSIMVSKWKPEIENVAAWPRSLAVDVSGNFCGYVMRMAEGYSVFDIWNPDYRVRNVPFVVDFVFLCRVASNLASVVGTLHAQDIILGDINPNSFRVNHHGLVVGIDCDSYQVSDGADIFRCEVGFGSYQAPEILESGSFDVVRGTEQDLFGLAIIIYQLMFMGRHPFMSVIDKDGQPYGIEEAIEEYCYPYSSDSSSKVRLAPNALRLDPRQFSKRLGACFDATFSKSRSRTIPQVWISEFRDFEQTLTSCFVDGSHFYPDHMTSCPWCNLSGHRKNVLFRFFEPDLMGSLMSVLPAMVLEVRDDVALSSLKKVVQDFERKEKVRNRSLSNVICGSLVSYLSHNPSAGFYIASGLLGKRLSVVHREFSRYMRDKDFGVRSNGLRVAGQSAAGQAVGAVVGSAVSLDTVLHVGSVVADSVATGMFAVCVYFGVSLARNYTATRRFKGECRSVFGPQSSSENAIFGRFSGGRGLSANSGIMLHLGKLQSLLSFPFVVENELFRKVAQSGEELSVLHNFFADKKNASSSEKAEKIDQFKGLFRNVVTMVVDLSVSIKKMKVLDKGFIRNGVTAEFVRMFSVFVVVQNVLNDMIPVMFMLSAHHLGPAIWDGCFSQVVSDFWEVNRLSQARFLKECCFQNSGKIDAFVWRKGGVLNILSGEEPDREDEFCANVLLGQFSDILDMEMSEIEARIDSGMGRFRQSVKDYDLKCDVEQSRVRFENEKIELFSKHIRKVVADAGNADMSDSSLISNLMNSLDDDDGVRSLNNPEMDRMPSRMASYIESLM